MMGQQHWWDYLFPAAGRMGKIILPLLGSHQLLSIESSAESGHSCLTQPADCILDVAKISNAISLVHFHFFSSTKDQIRTDRSCN